MGSGDFSGALAAQGTSALFPYLVYAVPVLLLLYNFFGPGNLRHIPTEGGSGLPLLSYKTAFNFLRDGRAVLRRGYNKHKGGVFKVALTDGWLVVLTGKQLVDELQRFPEEKVSLIDAAQDILGFKYIFGGRTHGDPFHFDIIRTQLTKNLARVFPDVFDEIDTTFKEVLPANEDEWVPVHVIKVARNVVARASNRVFVGLPMSRNPAYLNLLVNLTVAATKTRSFLALFPSFLKPMAAKMKAETDLRIQEGVQLLRPMIEDRMSLMEKFGDNWSDKPNDLLQWLTDELTPMGGDVAEIVRGILVINFAAIHTSSNSFTHALYHLAAQPEFIAPLREEVEAIVAEDGWSKVAVGKMWKLDSFMRESQRYNGVNSITVMRKTLVPLTLSDGTYIPKGTVMVTPAEATHFDNENYENADVFDPFRFAREKERDGSAVKHQYVTTSAEYVPFGHGKHACPGRFFAASNLKTMMAWVILNYDVKLENKGVRPQNFYTALSIQPNPDAKVLFRKRKSAF